MFTCAAVGMQHVLCTLRCLGLQREFIVLRRFLMDGGDGIQKQQCKCWEAVLFACSLSFIHMGMLVQLCQLSFSSGRKGVKNNAQRLPCAVN